VQGCTQAPPYAVTLHGVTQRAAGGDSKPGWRQRGRFIAGVYRQDKQGVSIRLATPPHLLEICGPGQAIPAFHRVGLPNAADLLAIPVYFLDVVVLGDGQADAPAQTTRFDNTSPVSRSHACPKTVHAGAAANFWLVCSFGHALFYPSWFPPQSSQRIASSGFNLGANPYPTP